MQHNSCFTVNPKITIGLEMRTPWRVHSLFLSHRFHWVKKVVVFGACKTVSFWCSCMQHNSCFTVNQKITIGLEMRTPWRVHSLFFSHRFHWVKKVVVFGACRTVKQSQQGCAIRVRVLGHWHSHNYDSCSVQCTPKISAKSDNGKLGFCFLHFSNTNLVVSEATFS